VSAVTALEGQVLRADALVIALAAKAESTLGEEALGIRPRHVTDPVVNAALEDARRHTRRWLYYKLDVVDTHAHHAIRNALAAIDLDPYSPDIAHALAAAWDTTTQIRRHLHQLGPNAEELALRLTPTWGKDLHALPHVVTAILEKEPVTTGPPDLDDSAGTDPV
jgi:hypothetical protein